MPSDLPSIDHVEDSLEVYLNPHARRVNAIYVAVIAILGGGLVLLPVVRVGVSVQADGIIRPATEKHEVVAGVAGYVDRVRGVEFARVKAGDELFSLVAEPIDARRSLIESQLMEIEEALADLVALTGGDGGVPGVAGPPRTSRYQAEHRLFAREMTELEVRRSQAGRELERASGLVALGMAPRAEAEERAHAVQRLEEERLTLAERYHGGWQAQAERLRAERRQLLERLSLLAADSAHHVIRAPVDGTIEEMASVSAGSFVQGGQRLAVISPATEMVAEVYLTPRDIGLLDPGAPVRLLIDAFPYADWGHLSGRVIDVPDDFLVMNDRVVFRTVVALDATELALPNGFRREVRKGMTLRARFMVAERSLWQLLRDDINDWVNPLHRPARPAGG